MAQRFANEPPSAGIAPLATYAFSGRVILGLALVLALVHVVFLGVGGAFLDIAWPSGPEFLPWLAVALLVVVPLHEALHALAAKSQGHVPVVKVQLPRVFTTFATSLPRNDVIVIALAPLVALNGLALALFLFGPLRLFAALCILLNTVGSAGDVWLAAKLLGHARDTRVLATDAGVEVWARGAEEAAE